MAGALAWPAHVENRSTAAMRLSDNAGFGVVDGLAGAGPLWGHDMAAGFDDIANSVPPLTTVRCDARAVDWLAAEMMVNRLQHDFVPTKSTLLPVTPVERAGTALLAHPA